MEAIRIAPAQFEHRSGDKKYNIGQIAKKNDITVLAGLFERGSDEKIYKAYVCIDKTR